MVFNTNDKTLDFALKLNRSSKRVDFKSEFPNNSDSLVGILDNFLQLNPFFRSSASEALKWKIFDKIRDKRKECSAPENLHLEVDRDDAFDYEKLESTKFVLKDFKQMVFDLAQKVHEQRQEFLK